MRVINLNERINDKISLALGFFDSVHLGHRSVLENTKENALEHSVKLAVLTFSNNPNTLLNKYNGLVFNFSERLEIFKNFGIDTVIHSQFDKSFMALTAEEFLSKLEKNFNIVSISVGSDYKFGQFALGDISLLKSFCINRGIKLNVLNDYIIDSKKCSTTSIKENILLGKVDKVNRILGFPYFISGNVKTGYGVGSKLGFPTANIIPSIDKLKLKSGVYSGFVKVDNKEYKAVINVGSRPTFSDDCYKIESFILDFDRDIYNKEITVHFHKRLRDIIKFDDTKSLTLQIENDIRQVIND